MPGKKEFGLSAHLISFRGPSGALANWVRGVKGLDHVKGLDQWHGLMVARMPSSSAGIPKNVPLEGRALHSQECFLPPLRRFLKYRCSRTLQDAQQIA